MPTRPPVHRPPGMKSKQQRMRDFDKARGSTTQRGYDEDWKRLRAAFLSRHPQCSSCKAPATDVDHVLPVRDRPDLRLAWRNFNALCHRCHSSKTAREGFADPSRRHYT